METPSNSCILLALRSQDVPTKCVEGAQRRCSPLMASHMLPENLIPGSSPSTTLLCKLYRRRLGYSHTGKPFPDRYSAGCLSRGSRSCRHQPAYLTPLQLPARPPGPPLARWPGRTPGPAPHGPAPANPASTLSPAQAGPRRTHAPPTSSIFRCGGDFPESSLRADRNPRRWRARYCQLLRWLSPEKEAREGNYGAEPGPWPGRGKGGPGGGSQEVRGRGAGPGPETASGCRS